MRKIIYSEYIENLGDDGGKSLELKEQGEADFLAFGVDFEELNDGVGFYSTAIIELEDGTVKNIPVEMVRFIK